MRRSARSPLIDAGRPLLVLAVLIALGWSVGSMLGHPAFDTSITDWFIDHRSAARTSLFLRVTDLGTARVLVAIVAATTGVLFVRRRPHRVLATPAIALLGTMLVSQVVKRSVGRERPPAPWRVAHASGFAFPSGHSIESIAVWGACALLLSTLVDGWVRWGIRVGAALVIAGVGISRVYLGVHWATDVIGGWLLGAAWLVALLAWARGPDVNGRR